MCIRDSVRHDVPEENIDVAWVPGAFEIPLIAKKMAKSGKYDAIICLGAVIRGDVYKRQVFMTADETLNELLVCLFKDLTEIEGRCLITDEFSDISINDMHIICLLYTSRCV